MVSSAALFVSSPHSNNSPAYGRGDNRVNDDIAHLKAVFEAKSSELTALRRRYQEALRSEFYQADAHARDAKAAAYAAVERGRTRHRQARNDEERDVLRDISRQRRDIRLSSQTRRGYEGPVGADIQVHERDALEAIGRERRGIKVAANNRRGFFEEIELDDNGYRVDKHAHRGVHFPSHKRGGYVEEIDVGDHGSLGEVKLTTQPNKTETKEQLIVTTGKLSCLG